MVATDYLIEYIKSVGKNSLNNHHIQDPLFVDLVISGGAFNYSYGYGSILYLKELQTQHKITIHKVSGCSSGSLLALLALSANFSGIGIDIDDMYVQMQHHYRETGNLSIIKDIIQTFVYKCIYSDEEAVLLSDKLFISTTDMSNCRHKVIDNYGSRADIVDAIISSCYIPYLIDGKSRYNSVFIDGIVPHMFKTDSSRTLYINLMNKSKICNMLTTVGEMNPHYRVIEGVVETAKFFNEGDTSICSWLNEWKFIDFFMFRFWHLLIILITLSTDLIQTFQIPDVLQNNVVYKSIEHFTIHLIHDFVFRCCIIIL